MESILQNHQQPNPSIRRFRDSAPRLVGFALLWWILTGGVHSSWIVGVPVVIGATVASLMLTPTPPPGWNWIAIARFLPFFLWQSLKGGADVARRALHPALPLSPFVLDYPTRLPLGQGRVFLANTISLLPGTLSAELRDDQLVVHGLDESLPVHDDLVALETRIAELFGIKLEDTA
jgi:multicomponent Na+:H+ antiporter subunit E